MFNPPPKMYDLIYESLEESGNLIQLENPQWKYMDRNEVAKENYSRSQITHNLIYPDIVFFVDEVSSNNGMKNYGNKEGQKFVVQHETVS